MNDSHWERKMREKFSFLYPSEQNSKEISNGVVIGLAIVVSSILLYAVFQMTSPQSTTVDYEFQEELTELTPASVINCSDKSTQMIQKVEAEIASSTSTAKPTKMFFNPTSASLSDKFEGLKYRNKSISFKQEFRNLSLDYPEFISDAPEVVKLNSYIKDIVFSAWEADEAEVGMRIRLASRYTVYGIIDDIVSMELVLTDFINGGNGNHDVPMAILYDLKTGRTLKTSELFCHSNYHEALYTYAYDDACANFPAKGYSLNSDEYWPDDVIYPQGWLDQEYSLDESTDYKKILLGKTGLIVIFDPYSIASGSFGIQRAYIKYSKLPNTICLP